MDKILIIDGGEMGKRVSEYINIIRKNIPANLLCIKYSNTSINENGKYHSLRGYKLAFIHKSDNMDTNGLPVFTEDAIKNKIPLILFSGGIYGFKIIRDNICEINDNLLKQNILDFLLLQIKSGFLNSGFSFFENKFNLAETKIDPHEKVREEIRSLKHDFLNKIARIFPEINTILSKINRSKKENFEFFIEFDSDQLASELLGISSGLNEVYTGNIKVFKKSSKKLVESIINNIEVLSNTLSTLNIKIKNSKNIYEQLFPVTELIESTKKMFEDLNNGIKK